MQQIKQLMQDAAENGVFPGGVLLVSQNNDILIHQAFGYLDSNKEKPVTNQTLYDLASLTKPLATTLAVMKLVENAQIKLDDRLNMFLDISKDTDKAGITLRHLLLHTSGLPDYRPFFKNQPLNDSSNWRELLLKWIIKEPLTDRHGQTCCYSDLGFMLLRGVVESVTGKRLDQYVQTEIYDPLQLQDLCFLPLEKPISAQRIAPTEQCPWRSKIIHGQVHDENAYAVGGVDGHAGLFGMTTDVHRLLLELLGCYLGHKSQDLFPQAIIREFLEFKIGTERGLGFDRPAEQDSAAGHFYSQNSVGHLGFTGTSFWMDLSRSIIVILLTNRIHPSRDNERIREFRPILHDTIMTVLGFKF
jgi:CubicO group peptidase (beta-lactamase class C family)